ncbi:MAG: hypothetical protein ABW199_04850 [Caulobacterales bacterium]
MTLSLQQVSLFNAGDDEGYLVFNDGKLVALLARLSPDHEQAGGSIFLEWGLGAPTSQDISLFQDLPKAEAWINDELDRRR